MRSCNWPLHETVGFGASPASLASQAWRPADGLTGGTPVSRATTRPPLVIIISSPPCARLTSLARSDCVFSNVAVIAPLKHFQGESQPGEIAQRTAKAGTVR